MKRPFTIALLTLAWLVAPARVQAGPDDQYVMIYGMIEQADTLAAGGQPGQALVEYRAALAELQKFAQIYPAWGPNIITFREHYLADKITANASLLPPETAAPAPAPDHGPATSLASTPVPAPAPPVPDAGLTAQVNDLRAQVDNLRGANLSLMAKLKEALAVQPATLDPRQLAAAQEQVRSLMKENEILRVSLARPQNPAQLQLLLTTSNSLVQAQSSLASLGQKLAVAMTESAKLAATNVAMAAELKTLTESRAGVEALREENALLKRQLAQARSQVTSLQEDARRYQAEKAALLEKFKALDAAKTARPAKGNTRTNAKVADLTAQLKTLQSRLAVDEAQPVPYTPEEIALFRQTPPAPQPLPAAVAEPAPKHPDFPAGTANLAASASTHFAAHEFDQAAADYQKILGHDENNGLVLANLAAIELQQGRLEDAEKHIQAALAKSPDNAFNQALLGNLRFKQGRYDEALDILSQAARLDPQNAEVQNLLGVALGHKGLRLAAETALRKAVVINPDYGEAQNNLAVIYISEEPPRAELARWHYLKALAAGQRRNPNLEKVLADNGAAVPAP